MVSNFIVQALKGAPFTVFGNGSQTRAFCYVDDLVEGMLKFMDAPDDLTGPVNLGNPQELSVIELAETVIRLTGSKSEIVFAPLPADDPTQRCLDIMLASDELGWESTMPLEQGVTETVAYFERLVAAGLA